MSKFVKISVAILVADEPFAIYLWNGKVSPVKKGGTFVGNYEVAPDQFRKYGIILPKGGMIIPDSEPDVLKKELAEGRGILVGRRNDAIKAAQAERESVKQAYLVEVTRLLGQYNIPGLGIVECLHESGNSSWGACIAEVLHGRSNSNVEKKTLLGFGNSAAFLLQREFSPGELESRVFNTPIAEVEDFLRAEAQIFPTRQQFMARLEEVVRRDRTALRDYTYPKGHNGFVFETWRGEMSGDLDYYPFAPGLKSAHSIRYEKHWPGKRERFYRFNEEDVAELERIVFGAEEARQNRLNHLWQLFVGTQGMLTSIQEDRYDEDGSYKESVYFVNSERLSPEEYKWLQGRLSEIPNVPDGFVRVKNGTNDFLHIPEMPGRNDVLVVEGKTGSRRCVWSYGEWFRGHPSKCQIDFWHKGTARKLKSVTLNGQVQESNSISLAPWVDPSAIAKWALQEAGMENPAKEYIEALAEVYQQLLATQNREECLEPAKVVQEMSVFSESEPDNQESSNGMTNLGDAFAKLGL